MIDDGANTSSQQYSYFLDDVYLQKYFSTISTETTPQRLCSDTKGETY